MTETPLVNRVAESGILTIDLEQYYPQQDILSFDLKDYLFHGLILKEKDFRDALKALDWTLYDGRIVTIHCSTDAIIPLWAYMLVSQYLVDQAHTVYVGTIDSYLSHHYQTVIDGWEVEPYRDARVVIKGCSHRPVPPAAYAQATFRLRTVALSLMFGEPCSTVPIYKRPKV
jgi:hypothetical protein